MSSLTEAEANRRRALREAASNPTGNTTVTNNAASNMSAAQTAGGSNMADAATTDISPSQSTLSPNFANYIYDMLARGQAAASQPFQEYTGQRFAGPSVLQQQAFQGLAGLVGGGGGYGGYGGGYGRGYGQPQRRALQMPAQGLGGISLVGGNMARGDMMPIDFGQPMSPEMQALQGQLGVGAKPSYMSDDFVPTSAPVKGQPVGGILGLLGRSARGEDMSGVQLPQGADVQAGLQARAQEAARQQEMMQNAPEMSAVMGDMDGGARGFGGFGGFGGQRGAVNYPSQFDTATRFATQAGERAGQAQYTPGQFTMGQVNAPTLQEMQMQAPADVTGAEAQAAKLGATPQVQAAQFQGPGAVGFERAQAERVAAPSLQNLQMQAAAPVGIGALQTYQMGPAERISTQGFTPQTAADLMSPYMQNVVQRQQQAAQREADIQSQAQKAQFAQAGAFGGSRQGIQQARAAEALARQKGDIQAQGLQSAYQQAQQQFNTQQQAAMQAALANQQAGLTTGQQNLAAQLGVQQLGTQAGLQAALANQQAQQQANLQNLSAGLQTQGLQAQTGLQAQQLNQATGLQAALANQQAGIQTGQFNAQQAYNTALQNAQLQQQAALANQQLGGQYGLQQGQFGQQAALQNAQMAQQAALANQQMGYNTGLQNLQARLGVQQLGAGQNLQAQLANQQALMQAQQAAEQSRQFGANVGLQGTGQQLSAAGTLGQLGSGQYGAQLAGINALLGAGATQQQLAQQPLDFGYQQYQQSLQYPYQQATFMQSLLQGLPLQAAPYSSGATGFGSALQGGLAGLGMYNALFGGK